MRHCSEFFVHHAISPDVIVFLSNSPTHLPPAKICRFASALETSETWRASNWKIGPLLSSTLIDLRGWHSCFKYRSCSILDEKYHLPASLSSDSSASIHATRWCCNRRKVVGQQKCSHNEIFILHRRTYKLGIIKAINAKATCATISVLLPSTSYPPSFPTASPLLLRLLRLFAQLRRRPMLRHVALLHVRRP